MGDDDIKASIEDIDEKEKTIRRNAPLLILRGAVGILAGIVLLFWPRTGLAVVSIALGIFLSVDGVDRLVHILQSPEDSPRRDLFSIVGAVLRVMFGVLIMLRPVQTGGFWISLVFVLAGLNLIIGSILAFWANPTFREDFASAGMSIGMLVLGLIMIILPMFTALALLRILGAVLILGAVPSLALGIRSR